jgi:NAD-dependent deacetylase
MRDDSLRAAAAVLHDARSVVVLTGAGMSAESGVPTFRDALTGEWSKFDPMRLASREGFRADPAFVWRWYAGRRQRLASVLPNAGHRALVGLERRFDPFAIVTQNVDGLHARAGSSRVLELHGNLMRTKCLDECGVRIDDLGALPAGEPPVCPGCGGWLRPDVVWFGEMLDPQVIDEAQGLAGACEVMVVVGTSGVVYPAAGLPQVTKERGGRVIVVNPNASEIDDSADILVRDTAANALPRLFGAAASHLT